MSREADCLTRLAAAPSRRSFYYGRRVVTSPPAWLDRASESRKNREKKLAELLGDNSLDAVQALRDWELSYRKECFYYGLRALLELSRNGKTKL